MDKRKELTRQYKETKLPMGIYQVKNNANGKIFIGYSTNLEGTINRIKFELKMGNYRNPPLQKDWNEYGESQFSFETIDSLKHHENDDGTIDYTDDLKMLEEIWLEKLNPYEPNGYNKKRRR